MRLQSTNLHYLYAELIMPWNEPGKDKDPWGQRNNDGPPDLDELLNNLKNKFGGLPLGARAVQIAEVSLFSLCTSYVMMRRCRKRIQL